MVFIVDYILRSKNNPSYDQHYYLGVYSTKEIAKEAMTKFHYVRKENDKDNEYDVEISISETELDSVNLDVIESFKEIYDIEDELFEKHLKYISSNIDL